MKEYKSDSMNAVCGSSFRGTGRVQDNKLIIKSNRCESETIFPLTEEIVNSLKYLDLSKPLNLNIQSDHSLWLHQEGRMPGQLAFENQDEENLITFLLF